MSMNHCPNCGYRLGVASVDPTHTQPRPETVVLTRVEAEALAEAHILTWDIIGGHSDYAWNQLILQPPTNEMVMVRSFLAKFRAEHHSP